MRKIFTLVFMLSFASIQILAPVHAASDVERDALVALYNATDGDNWKINNWLEGDPCTNEWYGVTCNDEGEVVRLDLYRNQLSGTIPPEIGNLTNLTGLGLSVNQLSGTIPSQIGNLTNLEALDLYTNKIGNIPPEIGNLTNLEALDLSRNQLSNIPPEIGNLTNLHELDLTYNQLSNIPPEIGNLANLGWLVLSNNQISGSIPPEIGNLTNLTGLYLGGNQLSGSIPSEIGNLTNLEYLNLFFNQLCEISDPDVIAFVDRYDSDWQEQQACQPTSDTERDALVALYNATNGDNWLDNTNWLEGNPCTNNWKGVTCNNEGEVVVLYLDNNQLSGSIPSQISNLDSLEFLGLSNNQLCEISDPDVIAFVTELDDDWQETQDCSGG